MIQGKWINLYNVIETFCFDYDILQNKSEDENILKDIKRYNSDEKLSLNVCGSFTYSKGNDFYIHSCLLENSEEVIVAYNDLDDELYYLTLDDMKNLIYELFLDMTKKDYKIKKHLYQHGEISEEKAYFIRDVIGCKIQNTYSNRLVYVDYDHILSSVHFEYNELDDMEFGYHCIDRILFNREGIYFLPNEKSVEAYIEDIPFMLYALLEYDMLFKEAGFKIKNAIEIINQ